MKTKILYEENIKLKEEIKNLKSDLHFVKHLLDNVSAEYKSLQNINKKLESEILYLKERNNEA